MKQEIFLTFADRLGTFIPCGVGVSFYIFIPVFDH